MEIEKRRQAEEALNDMQSRWQRIRQQLAEVGLRLPENLTDVAEGDQSDGDPAADLRQQFYLARFVSESIGRGIAKAEMEEEMDSQIEYKNFEIARLCDRLHYYEAMNREMSQRNQEALGKNLVSSSGLLSSSNSIVLVGCAFCYFIFLSF